jgi:hypothetical protein
MRLVKEASGALAAASGGLLVAAWLALPGYMGASWEAPAWPEAAPRAQTSPPTYGAPSWGSAPVLEPQPAVVKLDDALKQAEADFRRIEASTDRAMALDRERFERLQALYTTATPHAAAERLQPVALSEPPGAPSEARPGLADPDQISAPTS